MKSGHCCRCGCKLDPEAGRFDRNASDDDHVRYCVSCWNARKSRELRAKLIRGPREIVDQDGSISYKLGSPGENPLGYLRTFGIVGNPWAAWMARVGLLDDYFERPAAEQDAGDDDSLHVAEQLGLRIDRRRYMR